MGITPLSIYFTTIYYYFGIFKCFLIIYYINISISVFLFSLSFYIGNIFVFFFNEYIILYFIYFVSRFFKSFLIFFFPYHSFSYILFSSVPLYIISLYAYSFSIFCPLIYKKIYLIMIKMNYITYHFQNT